MESSGSSFIPKRPTQVRASSKGLRKVYVLSYVSYLLFIAAIIAVGGVSIYKFTLNNNLNGLRAQLVEESEAFNQSELERIKKFVARIDVATSLINQHVSVLTIFDALEKTVAEPVALTSFSYDREEDMDSPVVTLEASTEKFDSVIFQQQIMRGNSVMRNIAVEKVALSIEPIDDERPEAGLQQIVTLELVTDIPAEVINYRGAAETFIEGTNSAAIPTDSEGQAGEVGSLEASSRNNNF